MILIADSGSTKTDWCLCTGGGQDIYAQTDGINPFHLPEEGIRQVITNQLLPALPPEAGKATEVHFYGAGCLPAVSAPVRRTLQASFPRACISVDTDLLGAARALCQDRPGIACILGTGANSCLYDGTRIVQNISPLGYILGDEGSGAYLGKQFLSDCLKSQLPSHLRAALLDELQLDTAGIIERVYRQPQANRFLASISPFIHRHKADPHVHAFLLKCFGEFFRRNILPYSETLPVSFVGSIAWHFRPEIEASAQALGIGTSVFLKNPISKLVEFHHQKE